MSGTTSNLSDIMSVVDKPKTKVTHLSHPTQGQIMIRSDNTSPNSERAHTMTVNSYKKQGYSEVGGRNHGSNKCIFNNFGGGGGCKPKEDDQQEMTNTDIQGSSLIYSGSNTRVYNHKPSIVVI